MDFTKQEVPFQLTLHIQISFIQLLYLLLHYLMKSKKVTKYAFLKNKTKLETNCEKLSTQNLSSKPTVHLESTFLQVDLIF